MFANPNTVIMLIGNKIDLEDARTVSYEEAKKWADENCMFLIDSIGSIRAIDWLWVDFVISRMSSFSLHSVAIYRDQCQNVSRLISILLCYSLSSFLSGEAVEEGFLKTAELIYQNMGDEYAIIIDWFASYFLVVVPLLAYFVVIVATSRIAVTLFR